MSAAKKGGNRRGRKPILKQKYMVEVQIPRHLTIDTVRMQIETALMRHLSLTWKVSLYHPPEEHSIYGPY